MKCVKEKREDKDVSSQEIMVIQGREQISMQLICEKQNAARDHEGQENIGDENWRSEIWISAIHDKIWKYKISTPCRLRNTECNSSCSVLESCRKDTAVLIILL